jgi:hypothetical protein
MLCLPGSQPTESLAMSTADWRGGSNGFKTCRVRNVFTSFSAACSEYGSDTPATFQHRELWVPNSHDETWRRSTDDRSSCGFNVCGNSVLRSKHRSQAQQKHICDHQRVCPRHRLPDEIQSGLKTHQRLCPDVRTRWFPIGHCYEKRSHLCPDVSRNSG